MGLDATEQGAATVQSVKSPSLGDEFVQITVDVHEGGVGLEVIFHHLAGELLLDDLHDGVVSEDVDGHDEKPKLAHLRDTFPNALGTLALFFRYFNLHF